MKIAQVALASSHADTYAILAYHGTLQCALPGIVQIRPGKLVRRAAHDRLASVSKLWFCIMARNDNRAGPVERAAALAVHASFLEVYPPPEHLSDLLAGRLYAEPEFPYLN